MIRRACDECDLGSTELSELSETLCEETCPSQVRSQSTINSRSQARRKETILCGAASASKVSAERKDM